MKIKLLALVFASSFIIGCGTETTEESAEVQLTSEQKEKVIEIETVTEELEEEVETMKKEVEELDSEIDDLLNDI